MQAVQCDRLDNPKIYWLLDLAAEARAEHPESVDGAGKVDQKLRSALGKNLCASAAQSELASMCSDPSAVGFIRHMVRQLPFFVRPLVGDPCKADLVAAAARWLPRP
ncbi:MAG: hypothetical protein M3164_02920 [Actinomycetota bacterium]|nr:hypothetical protein [Actinomycetota bacterium]